MEDISKEMLNPEEAGKDNENKEAIASSEDADGASTMFGSVPEEKQYQKNNKPLLTLIFSAAALVILAGVCLVLVLTSPKTEEQGTDISAEEEEDTSYLVFSEEENESVKSISVKNKSAESGVTNEYVIEMTKEAGTDTDGNATAAEWGIASLGKAPLNQATFTTTVGYLAKLSAKSLVEENPADLSIYGLDDPQATVSVNFADGCVLSFDIGDEAPINSSTYVRKADNGNVYIISTYMLKPLLKNAYSYVDCVVMDAYDTTTTPTINKLTIERQDLSEPIIIEALPTDEEGKSISIMNTHTFTQPYEVEVDADAGQPIIYGLYGLTASEAVWVGLEESDYELAGLNDPICTVKMQVGGLTYTLTLGKPVGETTTGEDGTTKTTATGFLGTFSEIPDVLYVFPVESLPWLAADVDSLMARLFILPYIYDLDTFGYKSASQELTFTVDGDSTTHTFLCNGETVADEDRVKVLYQYLIGAYGEEIYVEEERGEWLGTLSFTYDDEAIEDNVIDIYSSPSDRKIIFAINGKNMFKCRQLFQTRLEENAQAYIDGGEIMTTW